MVSIGSYKGNGGELEIRTHDIPVADGLSEFMKQGWAPSPFTGINPHPSIPYTKLRRENYLENTQELDWFFQLFGLRINFLRPTYAPNLNFVS